MKSYVVFSWKVYNIEKLYGKVDTLQKKVCRVTLFVKWKLGNTQIRFFFFLLLNKNSKCVKVVQTYFPSLLSASPSRLTAVILVVPSDLLAAECCGCGLHPGGARALQRGRGRGLFHHLPSLLVVPHHGQPTGLSPKLFCPTLTVFENSKH